MARLLQKYYDVSVICPPPTYPFTKYPKERRLFHRENIDGIKVLRVWTFQPSKQIPSILQRKLYYIISPILSSFVLFKILFKTSYVIVSTPPSSLLITTLVTRLFKKRIILDIRDLWVEGVSSFGYVNKNSLSVRLVKKFETYCWKKADLIITNSLIVGETIGNILGNKNISKIKYFPFNVDIDTFKRIEVKREKCIIYIGNLGKAQNLEPLIRAVHIILPKNPELQVQIYGGGDCESELQKLIVNLKLEKTVKINNPVARSEIPSILSRAMIGIVPLADNEALRYALPTKTWEYFACSLPVLGYGFSEELQRIMKESGGGIYVRSNNYKEIAAELTRLVNDEKLLKDCSTNGRKFVEQKRDISFLLTVP